MSPPAITSIAIAALVRGGARPPPPPEASNVLEQSYRAFYKLPRGARYFVAGNIGNIVFYFAEKNTYRFLKSIQSSLPSFVSNYLESVSYFLSFLLQTPPQHFLNALLVYGMDTISTREKYIKTLVGTYSAFTSTLVLSTMFNAFLIKSGVPKNIAFFVSLYGFAIVNYFLIMWVVNRTTTSKTKKPTSTKVRGGGGGTAVSRIMLQHKGASFNPTTIAMSTIRDLVMSTGQPVSVED